MGAGVEACCSLARAVLAQGGHCMRLPGQPGCALRCLVGVLLIATLLGALVCFHAAADELANCSHPLFSFHQTMALALQGS